MTTRETIHGKVPRVYSIPSKGAYHIMRTWYDGKIVRDVQIATVYTEEDAKSFVTLLNLHNGVK